MMKANNQKIKIIGVIPARYASTRFPGKPLALLQGKPILQWVIAAAKTSDLLSEIYVATDDQRIADVAGTVGAQVVMTNPECATGTDRIYEATKNIEFDVVINIQGDEPLINKNTIDTLAKAFLAEQKIDMATLSHLLKEEDLLNKNAVKVITNKNNEAIYFSRFPIPFSRDCVPEADFPKSVQKHIGLYGYTKSFLDKFCTSPVADIEKFESLEQLRALDLGARIKVISVDQPTYGVDTPEDLQKLEGMLSKK